MSTNTGNASSGGFKTKARKLYQEISQVKRDLLKLEKLEKKSRDTWTKSYRAFLGAATKLAGLKIHRTQKESRLKATINCWPSQTIKLTIERDKYRSEIQAKNTELAVLGTKLAMLKEQELNETKSVNEIVTQVFDLNATVVQASAAREACLNRHVFPRLIDDGGKLRSQVSFISSDGLRRIVALVNTMTIIKGDLATAAQKLIQQFFERFQNTATMDTTVKPLFELTRQLLIEKIDFKVGPDLYRFLAMELDAIIFPELAEAQTLLRQSIRSEKTNTYIRIYQRESPSTKWLPVKQS